MSNITQNILSEIGKVIQNASQSVQNTTTMLHPYKEDTTPIMKGRILPVGEEQEKPDNRNSKANLIKKLYGF